MFDRDLLETKEPVYIYIYTCKPLNVHESIFFVYNGFLRSLKDLYAASKCSGLVMHTFWRCLKSHSGLSY